MGISRLACCRLSDRQRLHTKPTAVTAAAFDAPGAPAFRLGDRRNPPKISALEKSAVRIMRKLYKATGAQPQRWEPLDNLGATASDAAGIAYAVEKGWLLISGGLHSVSLTEAGRQRVK